MQKQSTLWTEQLRPKTFDAIIGNDKIKQFLKNTPIVELPHILLYGSPGTGKSSIAITFANEMYPGTPTSACSMYLNASDDRTLEAVRENIHNFLQTKWIHVARKIVILDEIETMTESAQLALRYFMDCPDKPLFILICNTVSRVVDAIRSRTLSLFCNHIESYQLALSPIPQIHSSITPLSCLLYRGDMRCFIHRLQQGEQLTRWVPWFQRFINVRDVEGCSRIIEEGLQTTPITLLLRHILLMCYALGLHEVITESRWTNWIHTLIALQDKTEIVQSLATAWMLVKSDERLVTNKVDGLNPSVV